MMRVLFIRTKMASTDPSCAYRALVPVEDVPRVELRATSYIVRENGRFVSLEDAWQTDAHLALPRGAERWESWKAHEALAKSNALILARQHFPELNAVEKWPELWVCGVDAESAEVWDEVHEPRR